MDNRYEYGVAAFRSRQQVMWFEDALRREGLDVRVINTPREVAVGCGLSVRFEPEDAEAVQRAIARLRPSNLIGVYMVWRGMDGRVRLSALSR